MELKTTAGLIEGLEKIDIFEISVNDKNCLKVRKKLESEVNKTRDILRDLKEIGKIKSISLPRNKELQEGIDNIVKFKEKLKDSIEKIKEIYFK